MKIFKITALAFLALFFIACGESENVAQDEFVPFKTGEKVLLKDVNGRSLELLRVEGGFEIAGEKDKVLMLDVFGTFCPPCQKEAPSLMQYQLDHAKNFTIVGLTHFENVSNEYVVSNFVQKYNAFYFISNETALNDRIAEQIVRDIKYNHEIALPFKVVLKGGKYQTLTDVDSGVYGVKYYLGGINWADMRSDLEKIYTNSK
ncbi:TlpA disulfide reductase family protein [Campylobacter sp. 19-13652]|uniref:TlpA disulfide reductase family protein n=1 Tax=Campylobacter sp. 19-13652 TaxID=2840180 RepID=UPI001C78A471|nr:TlpA disulfide reductase family protein [Campylobacter sp. 19-13652]BCX79338.1 thioredoxin [Campylobacter sp. 19-13652]